MDDQTLFFAMSVMIFVALMFGYFWGSHDRKEQKK